MTLKSWVIAGKKLVAPPERRRPQLTPLYSVCLTSSPETTLSGKWFPYLCCAFQTCVVAVCLNWCLYPTLGFFSLWPRGQGLLTLEFPWEFWLTPTFNWHARGWLWIRSACLLQTSGFGCQECPWMASFCCDVMWQKLCIFKARQGCMIHVFLNLFLFITFKDTTEV